MIGAGGCTFWSDLSFGLVFHLGYLRLFHPETGTPSPSLNPVPELAFRHSCLHRVPIRIALAHLSRFRTHQVIRKLPYRQSSPYLPVQTSEEC